MSELKPCPFCGAEAEILSDMCCTWALIKHRDGCLFPSVMQHEIPECDFAAWNTRHEGTCHSVEVSALETLLSGVDTGAWCSCSECKSMMPWWAVYCPNCGRKVEGCTSQDG